MAVNAAYQLSYTGEQVEDLLGQVTVNKDDIAQLNTGLDGKVDKVEGKGLSENDFTTADKNKLSGIASGAEVNVNADWDAASGDAQILNKPTIPSRTSQLTNDSGYITDAGVTSFNGQTGAVTYTPPAETDPVFKASPAYGISSSDISSWNAKQSALTFDSTPTANSTNPVTSAGIKAYVDNATPTITTDATPTSGSTNPVQSGGVYTALQGKQNTLTFDSTPTASSTNPVTSGGVKAALDLKANQSTTYTKTEVDALLDDVAYLGDDDGQAATLDFDPQADTVWNKAQTLGSSQQAQARNNIGAVGSVTVNGTTYTPTNGNVDLGTISGGGGSVTVDSALSTTSTNPVQNSVITTALNGKVGSSTITSIVSLTEAEYTALTTKDSSTLYVIVES